MSSKETSNEGYPCTVAAKLRSCSIREIPLCDLKPFKNHPYAIDSTNDSMKELVESVGTHGILVPGIARKTKDGFYEMISGHRRKLAAEKAGYSTMPMYVSEFEDNEAVSLMVDTNIYRDTIKPSEKAKAYKMKYDAISHQGKRGGSSLEQMSNDLGESPKQIQRYIKLNDLIPEAMELLDAKKITFAKGLALARLSEEDQKKSLESRQPVSTSSTKLILNESEIKEYFPENFGKAEMKSAIKEALEDWKNKRESQNSHSDYDDTDDEDEEYDSDSKEDSDCCDW